MRAFLLFLTILTFLSCSGDSTPDEYSPDNNNIDYKILKSIAYTDSWWGPTSIQFRYKENKLVKVLHDQVYYSFSYNNKGKIASITGCVDPDGTIFNSESSDCNSFRTIDYVYENNRLVRVDTDDVEGIWRVSLNYDGDGNIISKIDGEEDVYYTYDSRGNMTSITLSYQGESTSHSVENDGKINPLYLLWEVHGYFIGDLDFEPYDLGGNISKQNFTKRFAGNRLALDVNYNYDADGYPLNAIVNEYFYGGGERTSTVTYSYAN